MTGCLQDLRGRGPKINFGGGIGILILRRKHSSVVINGHSNWFMLISSRGREFLNIRVEDVFPVHPWSPCKRQSPSRRFYFARKIQNSQQHAKNVPGSSPQLKQFAFLRVIAISRYERSWMKFQTMRLPRISQMTSFALARDLRYAPARQGFSANSCHADRGTRWVTAKTRICGSILTVG